MRALAAVAVAGLGAASGIATVAVHDRSWAWWVLAVAAPVAAALALPPGARRAGFAAGWFALVFVAMLGRPEGDVVVTATPRGYGLLAVGVLLLSVAVVTIPRPRGGDS